MGPSSPPKDAPKVAESPVQGTGYGRCLGVSTSSCYIKAENGKTPEGAPRDLVQSWPKLREARKISWNQVVQVAKEQGVQAISAEVAARTLET